MYLYPNNPNPLGRELKNMKNNKKNKNHSGFSLLEMLISLFIFSLVIITSVSIFARVASTRQKTRNIQKNMEDARTALDLMAKNMRMSKELGPNGSGGEIHMLNNSQKVCVSYKFEANKLKMSQKPVSGSCVGVTYDDYIDIIESDNVSGGFDVVEASVASKTIGKATVVLTVDGIRLQTSVSFRDYNDIIQ